jgi:hypothetical protein
MSTRSEILELEERLRQAELGPDPTFFQEALADEVILFDEKGQPALAKPKVVEAHQPGAGPKFTRVEMREMKVVDHGAAAVVTCEGTYEWAQGSVALRFMRVWLKQDGRWRVIAGSVAPLA